MLKTDRLQQVSHRQIRDQVRDIICLGLLAIGLSVATASVTSAFSAEPAAVAKARMTQPAAATPTGARPLTPTTLR